MVAAHRVAAARSIERLRNENQPATAAAAPRAPEPAPKAAPKAAAPATPAAPGRKPRVAGPKPLQDEWGFFDPQQCGFAALLAKLNEITDDTDAHVH